MVDERLPLIIDGENAGVLKTREEVQAFLRHSYPAAPEGEAVLERRKGRWIVSAAKRA